MPLSQFTWTLATVNNDRISVKIDGPYVEVFEPVDESSDPLIVAILPGNCVTTAGMRRVRQKRESFAADLAQKLTDALVEAMESHDTKNGYSIS